MRNLFRGKYDLSQDIQALRERIHEVSQLRGTVSTPGWEQVRDEFKKEITVLVQSYMSLCDNPKKNEIEIRCKKMVSSSLGRILASIESHLSSAKRLDQELNQRLNDVPKKQDLY